MPSVVPVITAIQMPLRYGFWNLIVLSIVGVIAAVSSFVCAMTLRTSEKEDEEEARLEERNNFVSI
jgi:hypothetical protein